VERTRQRYEEKETLFGAPTMRWLERRIILDIVDTQWKDHLYGLDHLKEGIGLRGYGQKDPLVEFKKEAFTLFEDMMTRIDNETTRYLFLIQPAKPEEQAREIERRQERQQQQLQYQAGPAQAEAPKPVRAGAKVGRNDPCPCGSGKKYKKCHGQAA
jgi:preprotein translocase subunit SecA